LGRLSLVIADFDAEYIRNLEKYLILNYPRRFDITSFSSPRALHDFLESPASADIVLVNSMMYDEKIAQYDRGLVLLLTEDGSGQKMKCPDQTAGSVMKYQHTDRLISEVLRIYSAISDSDCTVHGRKRTYIISVASPAGGTGKSSIAAGCSILCAGRGLKAFYLCLEGTPSTDRFFKGESDQSFSNVIYYLKGSGPVWLRLESARCTDNRSGVHFFKPPESILEMNEFDEKDSARLLSEFRSSCEYDVVFVDLSPGLSPVNAEVMWRSDIVLLVLDRDPVVESKIDIFSKGLDLLESRRKSSLTDKIMPVLNFASGFDGCGPVFGYRPAAVIADCQQKSGCIADCSVVSEVSFLTSLNGIVDQLLAGRLTAGVTGEGGGSVA